MYPQYIIHNDKDRYLEFQAGVSWDNGTIPITAPDSGREDRRYSIGVIVDRVLNCQLYKIVGEAGVMKCEHSTN